MSAPGSVRDSLARGVRAARRKRGAVVWTYLAALLSSLPLALVIAKMVDSEFAKTLEADLFARHVDVMLMAEFVLDRAQTLMMLVPLLLGASVFWAGLSTFLNGAVLLAVHAEEAPSTSEFFAGGGRVFGRLLRLFFLGVGFELVMVALFVGLTFKGASVVTEDWVSERSILGVKVFAAGVSALIICWAVGAYDLMKVEAVAKGEHRARYAFVRGLKRAVLGPVKLLGIVVPFAGGAVVVGLIGTLIDVRITRSSWGLIVLGLVVQQLAVLVRAALKVGLAGAEVAYVRGERV